MTQSSEWPNVQSLSYPAPPKPSEEVHPWARNFEQATRRGDAVIRALAEHKKAGLEPDVILSHPGWGDAFFVRDYFPGAKVIGYFEYYYQARGADVGFDPEFPSALNDIFRLHAQNATQLLALQSCDHGICPTEWQRSVFPSEYSDKLAVHHEGIDTDVAKPDAAAMFSLPDGRQLTRENEVLTYVSRGLEPYRGFHIFMRALPRILRERPECQVLIIGEDKTTYGRAPRDGGTWKAWMQRELGTSLDWSRVHFTGRLAYPDFLSALQISSAHVYLTYPFVLSWSMLEAMSCGCAIVASDTAPVREFVQDGVHAQLFPFRDHQRLADLVIETLRAPSSQASLRQAARQQILDRLDFKTVSLPAYLKLLDIA